MLNLSDNELDRLSREAASQHDPGDPLGPRSWERLEVHLDKELGRAGPDISRGLRGFRRLPYQFAPVILLIVGVSYYFVKAKGRKAESSGSPPFTVVKTPQQQPGKAFDSSLKNPSYSDKSTSTIYPDQKQNETVVPGAAAPDRAAHTTSPGNTSPEVASGSSTLNSGSSTSKNGSSLSKSGAPVPNSGAPRLNSGSSGLAHSLTIDEASSRSSLNHTGSSLNPASGSHSHDLASRLHTGTDRSGKPKHPGKDGKDIASSSAGAANTGGQGSLQQNAPTAAPEPSGPYRSLVQRPRNLHSRPTISDSALRKYTAQTPTNPGKKSGPSLHVNRSMTFGLQVAPDFTSVNALAGDRPGSSLGLTLDYQFLNGWHVGTGLLFSRKNYTARATDYHVPPDYYWQNGLKAVDFVKGTMTMMEIPLNIRYDFSVTGNTIFFASGGVSSYLFGQEHCNYYYDYFGREVCRDFRYSNHNGLFSSANLSLGVETGVSNSVSVMLAPYMKLPISDIGFGRIRMNSVGINFAVRYTPVLSRKRK